MGVQPSTKLVQDVLTHVKRQFGDESGTQISDADIVRWINEGQLSIASESRFYKSTATSPSVAGQDTYPFSTAKIVAIDALQYNGVPVDYTSFSSFQENYAKYANTMDPNLTMPAVWYEYAGDLVLFPAPRENNVTIKIYYSAYPPVVSVVNDPLVIPDTMYDTLLAYCMEQAYKLDDDLSSSQVMREHRKEELADSRGRNVSETSYPSITFTDEDGSWDL
jgi:hypothetical protein